MELAAVRPQAVVLGLGLRACAAPAQLQTLWLRAAALAGITHADLAAIAVLQGKEQHPGLRTWLAQSPRALALHPIAPALLAPQAVASHSPRLQARYGTGCVAEAAALAAAGPGAHLLLARLLADDASATLALAVPAPELQAKTAANAYQASASSYQI